MVATDAQSQQKDPVASQTALPLTEPGKSKALGDEIDRLVAKATKVGGKLEGARIGIWVATPNQPTVSIVDRRGQEAYNSASNTKIVTIAATLALLGPEFRMHTQLFGVGVGSGREKVDRLIVVGGGDPLLSVPNIEVLARNLAHSGVRDVGRVQIDDSYFDGQTTPPQFDEQPREQAAFRAEVSATGLVFNSFAVYIIPSSSGVGPARVVLDPPCDYLRVTENATVTESRGRTRLRVETKERRGKLEIRVRGSIRQGAPRRVRRRIPNPTAFAGSLMIGALKRAGIGVRRHTIERTDRPPNARLLASHPSEHLAVLTRGLGKYSNNYMAEVLLKVLGAERDESDGPATWAGGLAAVRGYLTERVGLAPGSFVYKNGSGLFDSNRFSPEQMVRVLATASADARSGAEVVSALAIGGADGTLRSRMEDSAAAHHVRAKTGTLESVSALSGFATVNDATGKRQRAIFSILINDVPKGETDTARNLQDEIASAITQALR